MVAQHDTMVERLIQWEAGQTPGPVRVFLVPTNRCNLTCRMCWRQAVQSQGLGVDYTEISDERWLRLVDEAADLGAQEWCILGGGEPMLRGPLVLELCKRIRHHGINGSITTNGVLLNRATLEELIKIGWGNLHFSVDGPDAASNDYIRSDEAFERAKRNMMILAELKKAHGAELPTATLNSVITSANCDKLDQLVDFAAETGCTGGVLLSVLQEYGASNADLSLSPEQRGNLQSWLEQAAARAQTKGVRTNIDEFFIVGKGQKSGNVRSEEDGFMGAICFEAWLTAIISPNGRVGPCCLFWDDTADSIQDKPLQEVWLGPYMTSMRRRLIEGVDLPDYCRQCKVADRCRTQRFREEMRARQWDRWSDLPWDKRVRFVNARLLGNLRDRGVAETARRAWQWARIRARR